MDEWIVSGALGVYLHPPVCSHLTESVGYHSGKWLEQELMVS